MSSQANESVDTFSCGECGWEIGALGHVLLHPCLARYAEASNGLIADGRVIHINRNDPCPDDPNNKENEQHGATTMGQCPNSIGSDITQDNDDASLSEIDWDGPNKRLWTSNACKCLLDSYAKYFKLYREKKILTKRQIYVKCCLSMRQFGYDYSVEQVQNRMKCFEKLYKQWKDNKGAKKSGRGRLSISYEKELEEIFGKVHSMNPVCLIGVDFEYDLQEKNQSPVRQLSMKSKEKGTLPCTATSGSTSNEGNSENGNVAIPAATMPLIQLEPASEVTCANAEEKKLKKKKYRKLAVPETDRQSKERRHAENVALKNEYLKVKNIELMLRMKKYEKKYGISGVPLNDMNTDGLQ